MSKTITAACAVIACLPYACDKPQTLTQNVRVPACACRDHDLAEMLIAIIGENDYGDHAVFLCLRCDKCSGHHNETSVPSDVLAVIRQKHANVRVLEDRDRSEDLHFKEKGTGISGVTVIAAIIERGRDHCDIDWEERWTVGSGSVTRFHLTQQGGHWIVKSWEFGPLLDRALTPEK